MPKQGEAEQAALHEGVKTLNRDLGHHQRQPNQTDANVQNVAANEREEGEKKSASLVDRAESDHIGEFMDLENEECGPERERAIAEQTMRNSRYTATEGARDILLGAARGDLYIVLPKAMRNVWRFKRWLPDIFVRQFTHLRERFMSK